MLNYSSHLAVAVTLVSAYKSHQPMHIYLKAYFRQHKKHGSRDRKLITGLCYNYFRLGHSLKDIPTAERLLIGFFLCEHSHTAFLQSLKPVWDHEITRPINEKLQTNAWSFLAGNIFPYNDELSAGIDAGKFSLSFLRQPKLYLRIRPGFSRNVLQKLRENNIEYEALLQDCLALPISSKIDAVIDLNNEAVVQDFNSQKVGDMLRLAIANRHSKSEIWDCCAASGGKSIMAYDIDPSIRLTVSDKRESILKNLEGRFAKAGIKDFKSFVADFAGRKAVIAAQSVPGNTKTAGANYDLIIADVPCTGSGTWARTPEQLYYFDQKQIKRYSDLQKQIVENVIPFLKTSGFLLYITCSVFKKENEEVVNFITGELNMTLVKMQLLAGYNMQADTMFAALFTAPVAGTPLS